MKLKTFLVVSSVVAALQITPAVFAQAPDNSGHGRHRHGRHERLLANLTPEERAKLRAARHQAMADPAVQAAKDRARQARREYRDLRRAAMLRADPTLQPILDKIPERGRGDS
jgi:Spy/CpxP family protein refolding chaperone